MASGQRKRRMLDERLDQHGRRDEIQIHAITQNNLTIIRLINNKKTWYIEIQFMDNIASKH